MKTRLLAIVMLLCTFAAKAQYVTIPDANFVQFLQQNYSECMNGNQMDTTCWLIGSQHWLYINNAGISNFEGLQYFDNATFIDLSYNQLTDIPQLPPITSELYIGYNPITSLSPIPNQIKYFGCEATNLTSLPPLHDSLLWITCDYSKLNTLPSLPSSLTMLSCISNQLTSLPQLPNSLKELRLDYNYNINILPTLPDSLLILSCDSCGLTNLPALPNRLNELSVSDNLVSTFPPLPNSLKKLFASRNQISILPNFPVGLENLVVSENVITALPAQLPDSLLVMVISSNQISTIPPLPLKLQSLYCTSTFITSLPQLPSSLTSLQMGYNQIASLPTLPLGLKVIDFSYTSITSLPAILPPTLRFFACSGNQIGAIPPLPTTIVSLYCHSTGITEIPTLPDTMYSIECGNNPNLMCLPNISYVHNINITNTGIRCLPSYFSYNYSNTNIDTLPLCTLGNINGCPSYVNISGRTYVDSNNNCAFDSTDEGQYGLKHRLYSNGLLLGQTYSNSVGKFSFDIQNFSNYETRLDTTGLPFTIACPTGGVYYDTLTANDSLHFNRDFALQCETGFDLAAYSVASSMIFRPANNTTVDVHAGDLANFYHASCAQGVSGTVSVKLHGPISYIAPANGAVAPSNVSNNVLTWNVADFGTADALHDFNIVIQTDTFAQSGQQACFEVNVTPLIGDNDTSNNHLYFCFDIVNSYDPNDKTAYPSGNIDTTQELLTYTVRFQNTGTAEAQHIYIMDTLDANVKAETFQLLSYSHQPNVQIKENIVRFNFPFVNLPDSNTNEPGSHGYVQYKVKLKEDLPIGTAINNTAYIYFDFNPPVVTNTATNTIAVEEDTVEVGIRHIQRDMGIMLYPNPANNQITVSGSAPLYSITIYDIVGRIKLAQNVSGTSATIDISNLPSGLYVVGTGSSNKRLRLVKQ